MLKFNFGNKGFGFFLGNGCYKSLSFIFDKSRTFPCMKMRSISSHCNLFGQRFIFFVEVKCILSECLGCSNLIKLNGVQC
jgi:hypothetical protein